MAQGFDDTFDYLTMLGLDPLTVGPDPARLAEAVRRKKKEWTAQAINPLFQQQARAHLERARQFEVLLRDATALEAYLAYQRDRQLEQRRSQLDELRPLLELATGTGQRDTLTPGQRDLLREAAEARHIPVDVVDDLIREKRLKIAAGDQPGLATRLPYEQPALDKTLFAQIHGHLRVLHKQSFYELLDLPADTSPARIVAQAQVHFNHWSKSLPKTVECIAWEKSLQACMTYLKDHEGQTRYDRALFNARLDQFVWRIDLVLAAGSLGRKNFEVLTRIGARDFGLPATIISQCIAARAASKGVALTRPEPLQVHLGDLVPCPQCLHANPPREKRCTACGGSLVRKCQNPLCGKTLSGKAKVCEHCQLSVHRGTQYAELLKLADATLAIGEYRVALEACGAARQILDTTALTARVERASQIRALLADIRKSIARKQWSRVQKCLQQLVTLSPRCLIEDIPSLEEVTQKLADWQQLLQDWPGQLDLLAAARTALAWLDEWTDSTELYTRLRRLLIKLEAAGEYDVALDVAVRLTERLSSDPGLQDAVLRLRPLADEAREHRRQRELAFAQWQRGCAERRWYAAERALITLEELDSSATASHSGLRVSPSDAAAFRKKLAHLRERVHELKQFAETPVPRDTVIERSLQLLHDCRDCREVLALLQTIAPDPPAPPVQVRVTLLGQRRIVQWDAPAAGKLPTGYLVQRAVSRPQGGKLSDPVFTTLLETQHCHITDDEVTYNGSVVRYTVQGVLRGKLEVNGHVLREYLQQTLPVAAEPVLIAQEVLGLKARPTPAGLELRWHHPTGCRQVLLERWPGTRADLPSTPQILATPLEGRHLDADITAGQVFTYRLRCLYDGPAGDHWTPGVCLTHVGTQTSASSGSALPERTAAGEKHASTTQAALINDEPILLARDEDFVDDTPGSSQLLLPGGRGDESELDPSEIAAADTPTAAAETASANGSSKHPAAAPEPDQDKDDSSPLKRFGVWPPLPR